MRKLSDDDNGVLPELMLTPDFGFYISRMDIGFPTVEEDTLRRTQANGVRDYTYSYGESVVTIEGMLVPPVGISRQFLVDRLSQFCHPGRRVYLHWQLNDDDSSRCVRIRGRHMSRPIEAWNRRSFQVQWVAARGVTESSEQFTVSVPLNEDVELPGWVYGEDGRAYPRVYPEAGTSGQSNAPNTGNETAWPIIRLWGGVTNPVITNLSSGKQYEFQVVVPANNYLEIDTAEALITMNGDINDSRYDSMQTSEWWGLEPGDNLLTYTADSSSGGIPRADVIYRYAYL